MKAKRLKNLRVKRVDLVDQGASYDKESGEGAHVLLYKHADGQPEEQPTEKALPTPADVHTDKPMGEEEDGMEKAAACKCGQEMDKAWEFCPKCGESMNPVEAEKSAEGGAMPENDSVAEAPVEPKPEETAAPAEDVAKRIEDLEKAAAEREELAKRLEDVEKRASEAEAKLAKAAEDARVAEFVKRAGDEYPNLPATADALGLLLKRIHDAMPEDAAEIERIFKSANGIAQTLTVEQGRPGANTQVRSAAEEFETAVKAEIEKSAGKLRYAEAAALVSKANPELYERQRRESFTRAQAAN